MRNEPRLSSLAHGGGCGCKIAPGILSRLLATEAPGILPKELLVGLETSDDAAVYQLNPDQALIATTDFFMPMVDDPEDFGRIAATNALSDVYAMGGTPIFALAILGMPINTLSPETIRKILAGGQHVCQSVGIPIAGGHSIDSMEPFYGLVVLGLAHPSAIKRNADGKAHDVLILGKPLGVGVLSHAFKQGLLDSKDYEELIRVTTQLNALGPALSALHGVHALTDVTGFGLAGHVLEVARGSQLRAFIDWSSVPLLASATKHARAGAGTGASLRNWASYGDAVSLPKHFLPADKTLLTDPQTSGGLLVSCEANAAQNVLAQFHRAGFDQAAIIGRLAPGEPGLSVD